MKETRNSVTLRDFMNYCKSHPDERFWQALRNWSEQSFIYATYEATDYAYRINAHDTFYWEGKND